MRQVVRCIIKLSQPFGVGMQGTDGDLKLVPSSCSRMADVLIFRHQTFVVGSDVIGSLFLREEANELFVSVGEEHVYSSGVVVPLQLEFSDCKDTA